MPFNPLVPNLSPIAVVSEPGDAKTVSDPESKSAPLLPRGAAPESIRDKIVKHVEKAPILLKPGSENRPEHWAIRIPKLVVSGTEYDRKEALDDCCAPQIFIHKSSEWEAAWAMKSPSPANVQASLKKMRRALEKQDLAGLPGYIAEHFRTAKKKLHFAGGHGFRMLAQEDIETNLVRKGRLTYIFIGMSDDNSCQILATFPIDLPGLPADEVDAEHLGYSSGRYAELSKGYAKYERAAIAWLNENTEKMTPSLAELDAMMSSLVVKKWE
jgi:hypothetical protein